VEICDDEFETLFQLVYKIATIEATASSYTYVFVVQLSKYGINGNTLMPNRRIKSKLAYFKHKLLISASS